MKFEQYKHQLEEYESHRDDKARAYFWQMRTGKSKMTIDNACYLEACKKVNGVLLLAPNGVHLNWLMKELPLHHWTGAYNALAWEFSNENMKAELNNFIHEAEFYESNWFAINLESMTRKEVANAFRRFQRVCPNFMLVCDESHHFRRPGAKRTARARAWARKATYNRILTGTSCDNSPLHAFSQYELLEKGALGFTRADEFQDHFAVYVKQRMKRGRSYLKLDRYINLDELKERMAPLTSVVLREDCEDLPEVLKDTRLLQLTGKQLKAYRAVTKDLIEECEMLGLYDPITGGAKMMKLQQILSGFVIGDNRKVKKLVDDNHNPRLIAILDEVEQHQGKVLIWCRFTQDIINVREMLTNKGIPCTEYHGKMANNAARVQSLERFEKDDKYRVMIGQPQAGGEGRDFSAASKIVWYSHIPDNIVRSQADERATAIGGDNVQLIDFVVPNSVDSYFLELLDNKRTVADDVARYGLKKVLERIQL